MGLIISAAYMVVVITYVLISLFIVFHLIKYSINASLNWIMLPLFLVVSSSLLLSNLLLFYSINWNDVLAEFSF